MMRLRSIRRLFSLSSQVRRRRALGFDLEVPEEPRISLRGYPAQQRSGKGGMSGAIIGMHMHDKTSTTAQSKDRQQHSRTIKTGTSAFKRAGRVYSASLATGAQKSTP